MAFEDETEQDGTEAPGRGRGAKRGAANDDVKVMSFEQALEALERIVDDLERGEVPLDESIRIYERGEALKAHCDRLLKSAEDKVEKIRLSREGKPVGVEPLDPE